MKHGRKRKHRGSVLPGNMKHVMCVSGVCVGMMNVRRGTRYSGKFTWEYAYAHTIIDRFRYEYCTHIVN